MTLDANRLPFESLADVLLLLPLSFFLSVNVHFLCWDQIFLDTSTWGLWWSGLMWHSWREQSFSVCATAGLGFHNEKCGEDY